MFNLIKTQIKIYSMFSVINFAGPGETQSSAPSFDFDNFATNISNGTFDIYNPQNREKIREFLKEIAAKNDDKKIHEDQIGGFLNNIGYALKQITYLKPTNIEQSEVDYLNDFVNGVETQTVKATPIIEKRELAREEIKTETKEKTEELKLQVNETLAISYYLGLDKERVSDVNLPSAISVLLKVSGDKKEDWEKAGYEYDGNFFGDDELSQLNALKSNGDLKSKIIELNKWKSKGYDVVSIVNTKIIAEKRGEKEILSTLLDFSSDGKVDGNDKWLISGEDLNKFLENNKGKKTQIISNICDMIGVSPAAENGLFEAIKKDPSLKYDFFSKLYLLAMSGVNISTALVLGKSGIQKSIETAGKNLLIAEKLSGALLPGFEQKYDEAVKKLDEKLASDKLSEEERKKLQELRDYYAGNKESFLESFKFNGAGALLSLVEGKKGVGLGASFTNENANEWIQKVSDGILKGMNLNLGASYVSGKFIPGVGIDIPSKDFDLGGDFKVNFNAGTFLIFPYVAGTLKYNYNREDLEKTGFLDFSKSKKYAGISGNIGFAKGLSGGVGLHWSKEKLEAINDKEKQFSGFLDEFFEKPVTSYSKLSEDDKKYLGDFTQKIADILKSVGYSDLSQEHQEYIKKGLKRGIINIWKNAVLEKAEKDGLEFSGAGIGLQFIAGFLPMLTAGVRFSETKRNLGVDRQAMVGQALSNGVVSSSTSSSEKRVDVKDAFTEFKREDVQNYLNANISKFDGTNGSSPVAMRNPKDYPKFLEALKSGNTDVSYNVLMNILRTDVVLRKDKATIELRKTLENPALTQVQKAYIVAQFMDVIFKDKVGIEKVIGDDKLWEARNRGLQLVYPPEVYTQIVDLRDQVRAQVKDDIKVQDVKGLLGFVASYKVGYKNDGKEQFSLGRGEAAIPPGLATAVGGEKGLVIINSNEKLVNHIIENLMKTPYKETIKNSLSKFAGFQLSDTDLVNLLKNGKVNKDGKEVEIQRDFSFFLYGRCANETLGVNITGVKKGGSSEGFVPVNINIYEPTGEQKDYVVGVVGDKSSFDNLGGNGGSNSGGNGPNSTVGGGGNNTNVNNSGGGNIGG